MTASAQLTNTIDFRVLFAQSSQPINVYDKDLKFVYANQAYLDATQTTLEAIIGKHVFDVFPHTDIPQVRYMFEQILAGVANSYGPAAYQHTKADGTKLTVYWRASQDPIRDVDGSVLYILERALDVTDEVLLSDKNDTIAAELDHRVRNLMTVLQSVAAITAQNATDVEAYTSAFQNRLAAIARTYHDLANGKWKGLAIRQLIEGELRSVADPGSGRYSLEGPDISLTVKSTKDASLVLHEMVTNAVKYGCFTRPDGHLKVRWGIDADQFIIEWEETGMQNLQPPRSTGFGSRLIGMMPYMKVEREFRPTGLYLRCSVAVDESINRFDFQAVSTSEAD